MYHDYYENKTHSLWENDKKYKAWIYSSIFIWLAYKNSGRNTDS